MSSAPKFLTRYSQEADEFLHSIVTGDETWGFHLTPESKHHSLQWRHTKEVMTCFKGQAAGFHDSGTQKLVPRLNKCLENAGDYVKK
jgi:hypothetical protein